MQTVARSLRTHAEVGKSPMGLAHADRCNSPTGRYMISQQIHAPVPSPAHSAGTAYPGRSRET